MSKIIKPTARTLYFRRNDLAIRRVDSITGIWILAALFVSALNERNCWRFVLNPIGQMKSDIVLALEPSQHLNRK